MPRTKVKKPTVQKSKINEEVNSLRTIITGKRKAALAMIEKERAGLRDAYEKFNIECRLKIPNKYLVMNMTDISKIEHFDKISSTTMSSVTLSKENMSVGKSTKNGRKPRTRSSSCLDEGPRPSRSKVKIAKNPKKSRSLSRTTTTLATPLNHGRTPNSFGLITPKVTPNTPLVLVRRPKIGEMVVSVSGSPVLANPFLMESRANINIPLKDGTLLSVQAEGGLRKSHVPILDPEVRRQLEMLRHNINIILPHKDSAYM